MPIRKHYECTDSMNRLDVLMSECETELLLKITNEDDYVIEIKLTLYDLIDLMEELETINQMIYEKTKGGNNG